MLQDIAPLKYRNPYEPEARPRPEDAAVFQMKNGVYLRRTPEGLAFPSVKEADSAEMGRFLFRIDGRGYFLYRGDAPADTEFFPRRELRRERPKAVAFAAITACQLGEWYSLNAFCGRCGQKTQHDARERMVRCPACGNVIYPKICPAVITAVTKGDSILLTRYAGRSTGWALVAGFNEIGEGIEDTVRREVMEEVGLRVKNLRFYKSQPWSLTDTLLMGFWCEADGDDEIRLDTSELGCAQWVKRDEIDVAFDDISLTNEMITVFKNQRP